ncbi:MAG: response regulator [Spirochaetes bacterium]|nr:MAG: response regulator [Spirochaetota bacterium]
MEPAETQSIVVIDDEEIIRYTLQKKLSRIGYHVISLEKAEDMIYLLKTNENDIDLVITDIKLRKMDGIELLRHISAMDKPIPTLIITGQANVEDAIRAMRYGACDIIRKPFDINEVASTVRGILRRTQEKELAGGLGKYVEYEKGKYTIPVDGTLGSVISYQLTQNLAPSGLCNNTTSDNIAMAIREAVSNAMFHGNLEVPSSIREDRGLKGFNDEIELRKGDGRYSGRMVKIEYELTRDYVEYFVEDEGPGFNFRDLPDPRDPENFLKDSGRGLLIIRIHMDEVDWNEKGNRIRFRKYRVHRNSVA